MSRSTGPLTASVLSKPPSTGARASTSQPDERTTRTPQETTAETNRVTFIDITSEVDRGSSFTHLINGGRGRVVNELQTPHYTGASWRRFHVFRSDHSLIK